MDIKLLKEITIKNLLLFFRIPFAMCLLLLVITAAIFPTAGLTGNVVCKPLEMLLSFLGTITMVQIFLPEQDMAVYDSVACRKIGIEAIYFIRLIIAVILIAITEISFCVYMKINECDVTAYIIWGGIASAFFMGSIGFFAAGVTKNVINGILASMIYYICNLGLKKQLGVMFLFRMSTGVYKGKIWLFGAGIIFVLLTFLILEKRNIATKQ